MMTAEMSACRTYGCSTPRGPLKKYAPAEGEAAALFPHRRACGRFQAVTEPVNAKLLPSNSQLFNQRFIMGGFERYGAVLDTLAGHDMPFRAVPRLAFGVFAVSK